MPSHFLIGLSNSLIQKIMNELLDSIYQIGEKMIHTLAEDNLKGFYTLLEERQAAIQQLSPSKKRFAPKKPAPMPF